MARRPITMRLSDEMLAIADEWAARNKTYRTRAFEAALRLLKEHGAAKAGPLPFPVKPPAPASLDVTGPKPGGVGKVTLEVPKPTRGPLESPAAYHRRLEEWKKEHENR